MEIIIEIGTIEQQLQTREELQILERVLELFDDDLNLSRNIVAEDIEKTVNEVQATNNYRSERGVEESIIPVQAKNVNTEHRTLIV